MNGDLKITVEMDIKTFEEFLAWQKGSEETENIPLNTRYNILQASANLVAKDIKNALGEDGNGRVYIKNQIALCAAYKHTQQFFS